MKRYHYGNHPDQFGDLYRPQSSKKLSVLLVIHGGYWKDNHDLNSYATKSIVEHYAKQKNVAVWNLEYRRMELIGMNTNAQWPAILEDAARGIDFLKHIARAESLDLSQILVVGHSAGGHLSAWLSSRAKISKSFNLYYTEALIPARAVVLAGILDLSSYKCLSQPVQVERFIGGSFDEFPDRYSMADPLVLRDENVPLTVIHGLEDQDVPIAHAQRFVQRHKSVNIQYQELSECGHFGMLPQEGKVPRHWKTVINVLDRELRFTARNE
jgi:acetyl esterase/lipase